MLPKNEVFSLVYEASKHRCNMDKIDKLFNYAQDTLVPHVSDYIRCVIFNTVESIFNIRAQLKLIEKDIRKLAVTF